MNIDLVNYKQWEVSNQATRHLLPCKKLHVEIS